MTTSNEPILLRADHAGVVTLTLNRPAQFNALSTELLTELQTELEKVGADKTARVLVIAGAGRAFCSTPAVALARNMGRKPALEMLLTGDFIDAAEAQRRGLVNRVVPAEQLDAEVKKLIDSICAKSADAIAMGKQFFYRQIEMGLAGAYQLAAETMACNMMTEDAVAGIDGFMNKRKG